MRANGATATAQYSTNGTTWTEVGKARDISDLGTGQLGPFALRSTPPPASRRSSTTCVFGPPGSSRRSASRPMPSASSARSTATRRTRCRRRRCRRRARSARRPTDAVRRRPDADARHVGHQAEPRRLPRPDADARPGGPEDLHQAALLRHHRRRHGRRHLHAQVRHRCRRDGHGRRSPDWCGSPTAPSHVAIGPFTAALPRNRQSDGARCSIYPPCRSTTRADAQRSSRSSCRPPRPVAAPRPAPT